MVNRVNKFGLKVDAKLVEFIDNEVLSEAGLETNYFWKNFNDFITKFSKKTRNCKN